MRPWPPLEDAEPARWDARPDDPRTVAPVAATASATPPTAALVDPSLSRARRSTGESLDWRVIDALRAFSSADLDLVRELVANFEVNVTRQLPALERAVRHDDAETTQIIAHGLRGTSGNIGARRMAFLCERLEELGRGGVTIGGVELVADLWTEFARVRTALGSDTAS